MTNFGFKTRRRHKRGGNHGGFAAKTLKQFRDVNTEIISEHIILKSKNPEIKEFIVIPKGTKIQIKLNDDKLRYVVVVNDTTFHNISDFTLVPLDNFIGFLDRSDTYGESLTEIIKVTPPITIEEYDTAFTEPKTASTATNTASTATNTAVTEPMTPSTAPNTSSSEPMTPSTTPSPYENFIGEKVSSTEKKVKLKSLLQVTPIIK